MNDIYKELILDHYRNPRNKRQLQSVAFQRKEYNAFCGDELELYVKLSFDDTVKEVSFTGDGCAISQAAASLFTEQLPGKHADEVMRMDVREMQELLGISLNAVRVKCALLVLHAFQNGWRTYHGK